jgi:hypothetical protein
MAASRARAALEDYFTGRPVSFEVPLNRLAA